MLRYLGPKLKKLKRLSVHILPGFSTKYYFSKFNLSSINSNKTIVSFFLLELLEKQKLKFNFCLTEKMILKYLHFIHKYKYRKFNLLNLLELRLDTVLFKIGYCITLAHARQLITHGHFFVNFVLINKPSYLIKIGDVINLSPKSYYIFKLCKQNIYHKYNSSNMFIENVKNKISMGTLTSIIFSLSDIKYNFIRFNEPLIQHYYHR